MDALSLPVGLLAPMPKAPVAEAANPAAPIDPVADAAARAKINKTAKAFEASFVSIMLGQMFEGVSTAAPFGGGQSETAFRSFLTDAMGQSIAKHGGLGVADQVRRELLKLQGLT